MKYDLTKGQPSCLWLFVVITILCAVGLNVKNFLSMANYIASPCKTDAQPITRDVEGDGPGISGDDTNRDTLIIGEFSDSEDESGSSVPNSPTHTGA